MEEINDLNNPAELDVITKKIMNTRNDKIASKYARKLDKMNVNEKIRLFKETKVPLRVDTTYCPSTIWKAIRLGVKSIT